MTSVHSAIPPRIPDHEILKPIGRGSYGEVWLARNIFGTLRAVKTVRRESFSSVRPYEREFAGIQRFEPVSRAHEGLVDILQVGRNDAEGFFYYVMELADPAPADKSGSGSGPEVTYSPWTLSEMLEASGPLAIQDCIRLFHGLAIGLSHLHRAGLVHRDIKPSNIIFVGGSAKFADIGLVTTADESLSYVGTEGYIPPEGAGTVSADLYSLGKVIYEAATGKDRTEFPSLPLESGELRNETELIELNAIWLKACAQSPADRYRSSDELASDLALLQAGRSVKRLRMVERRFKQVRQLAVFIGLIACAAGLLGLLERHRAQTERGIRLQAERLRKRAETAEQSAQQRLEESHIAQARAVLKTSQIGRRSLVLSLLTNVTNPDLRTQARSLAATALVLPDLIPTETPPPRADKPVAEPAADGTIVIRKHPGGAVLQTVPSQNERVREPLWFSPDRNYLYAGYGRFVERIWDLTNRRLIASLDTNYYELAFRPDRAEVAVAYVDNRVKLHALNDWRILREWKSNGGEARLRWSSNGRQLLIYFSTGEILIADPDSDQFRTLENQKTQLQVAAWHPDATHIALCGGDGYVRIRATSGWTDNVVLSRHEAQILDAQFLPPFPWLLTSSWDGTSRLWDWHAGYELGRLESTAYGIKFDRTNHFIDWRFGAGQSTRRWRLMGSQTHREIVYGEPRTIGGPFMISWSGDSRWIAGPDQDGVRVWSVLDGVEKAFLPGSSEAAWMAPSGREILVNAAGEISHWKLSLDSGAAPTTAASKIETISKAYVEGKLAVSLDSRVLAWIDGSRIRLRVDGRLDSFVHGQEQPETVAVSSDGSLLAVGTRNHVGAQVFDSFSHQLLWKTDIKYGTHLEFSRDGGWLAIGTDSGCRVFESRTGKLRWHRPPGKDEELSFWEVAFSPGGELLAWTPTSTQIQLLNARTGEEILTLDYPTRRYITRLKFSPDGTWLAESSNKHTIHLWNIRELRSQLKELKLDWDQP